MCCSLVNNEAGIVGMPLWCKGHKNVNCNIFISKYPYFWDVHPASVSHWIPFFPCWLTQEMHPVCDGSQLGIKSAPKLLNTLTGCACTLCKSTLDLNILWLAITLKALAGEVNTTVYLITAVPVTGWIHEGASEQSERSECCWKLLVWACEHQNWTIEQEKKTQYRKKASRGRQCDGLDNALLGNLGPGIQYMWKLLPKHCCRHGSPLHGNSFPWCQWPLLAG